MKKLSAVDVVIVACLVVGVVYICFMGYKTYAAKNTEHFVATDEYQSRMDVMKVFDLVLARNPTPEEISKYSELGNEQDIFLQVVKDYKDEKKKANAVPPAAVPVFAEAEELKADVAVVEEEVNKEAVETESPEAFEQDATVAPVAATKTVVAGPEVKQVGDHVCVSKHYVRHMLDDMQTKLDSVRVMLDVGK